MASCRQHLLFRRILSCVTSRARKQIPSQRWFSLFISNPKSSKNRGSFELKIYDVVIVGGGIMGSSSAYFLANRMAPEMGRICVIEQDPTYTRASTVLSLAGIRSQFSMAENIQMCQFSFQFMSDVGQILAVDGCDPPDIQLRRRGYLFLASSDGEDVMQKNYALQRKLGCQVTLLTVKDLKERFPWLNTEGLSLASLGTGNEGYFDPWSLLNAFKRKAISLGVDYVNGEAVDFDTDQNGQISSVKVVSSSSPENANVIHCGQLVNAAGPNAGYLAEKLGIDLPVRPRKRYVFVLDCPGAPVNESFPLGFLVDPSGLYLRHDEARFLSGLSPKSMEDYDSSDFEVDYDYFTDRMWETIAHRIPAFECLKVQSAWAGHYDYNTLDQNAIIGRHPEVRNLIFVNGFSGHGIQQSPAAGRAVSELILDDGFQTIDLSQLGFERVLRNEPMREKNIV